jgi:hypothetical protein
MFLAFFYYVGLTLCIMAPGVDHAVRDRTILIVACCASVLFPLGQAVENARITYPFDHWGMYDVSSPALRYYEFTVLERDGDTADYPFEVVSFASPGPLRGFTTLSPLSFRLVAMASACKCTSRDPKLDRVLAWLVANYGLRSGSAVVEFRISEGSLSGARGSQRKRIIYRWVNPEGDDGQTRGASVGQH